MAGAPTPVAPSAAPRQRAEGAQTGMVSWANLGFDAGQDGFNNREKTLTASNVGSLSTLWESSGSQNLAVPNSIAAGGGRIFINDYDEQLQGDPVLAFDAKTGKLDWTTASLQGTGTENVAFGDGLVFDVADSTHVCAFHAATGKQAWCFEVAPSKYCLCDAGLTYADGAVVFGAEGGPYIADALTSVNAKTGAPNWSIPVGGFSGDLRNPPVVSKGNVYFYCSSPGNGESIPPSMGICAYSESSGATVWDTTLVGNSNSEAITLIAGTNGVLYYSLNNGQQKNSEATLSVGALSDTGKALWSHGFSRANGNFNGVVFGLAVDTKTLYGQVDLATSYSTAGLYAMNAKTGKLLWHDATSASGAIFWSSPSVANGVIYTNLRGSCSGAAGFSTTDGSLLWSSCAGGIGGYGETTRPIVVNGAVYASCNGFGGYLCEFGLKS